MGIEIIVTALLACMIGFVIAKAMGSKNEQKLAEAQRRIDVLMVENEDLTAANQNLLDAKDKGRKSADLVKKQSQVIETQRGKLEDYGAVNKDMRDKLIKANLRNESLKEKVKELELYKSLLPPFWKETTDRRFDEAKCKSD